MKALINFMVSVALLFTLLFILTVSLYVTIPIDSADVPLSAVSSSEVYPPLQSDDIPDSVFPDALPQNPLDSEAFFSVLLYAAKNDLTKLVINYTIPYQECLLQQITVGLEDALRTTYKYPEYCNYLRKISYSTVVHKTTFTIIVHLADNDGNTAEMISRRSQAITQAAVVYDGLCKDGSIREEMSEKEKARVLLNWVLDNTSYKNDGSRLNHTAYSVFFNGKAVCDGYSSAYHLLLRQAGIKCQGRKGYVGSICHLWTVCVLDGEVVNVDVTGCESNVDRYFAVSDKEIARTHSW